MTNGWTDIRNADVILAMGGNPAENHPVGFRFVMEAKRNRNAKLVTVDPRFNRTAAVADRFVQIRAGTDIAFLGGLINHALTHYRYHDEYVRLFTNAPLLVSEQFTWSKAFVAFSLPGFLFLLHWLLSMRANNSGRTVGRRSHWSH